MDQNINANDGISKLEERLAAAEARLAAIRGYGQPAFAGAYV